MNISFPPALLFVFLGSLSAAFSWTVVDTGQDVCYDETKPCRDPKPGERFFGQDAQYSGTPPSYRDNSDGTVTDLQTGLMWSKAVDPKKVNLSEAETIAKSMTLGGHQDWRVPNIKELYSLMDFRGITGLMDRSNLGKVPATAVPYINTDYFDFLYGDAKAGERFIDAQWLSSTPYTSTTMEGIETLFGVNFADGRIKGYGVRPPGGREKKFYARYVRGEPCGKNEFVDNGDGTVTDRATGLIWTKADSGRGMTWEEALRHAQGLTLAGQSDWRLPNAKELQSLVDYTRSPDATDSPAIDPVFETTSITNESGQKDWPFFWTSTSHADGPNAQNAVYISFGRAIGMMHGTVMDVHGAGAQRSDPKTGKPAIGHGPQGDAQRVKNFVRCVRGGDVVLHEKTTHLETSPTRYPNTIRIGGKPEKPTPFNFSMPPAPPDGREAPPMDHTAPGGGRSPGGDSFIKRLDRNGDSRVSRDEFDGPPEHFDTLDKNRDGTLSADEAPSRSR